MGYDGKRGIWGGKWPILLDLWDQERKAYFILIFNITNSNPISTQVKAMTLQQEAGISVLNRFRVKSIETYSVYLVCWLILHQVDTS